MAGQYAVVALDIHEQLGQLGVELFAFQPREALEAHVKYRLRLDLGEAKLLDEVVPRRRRRV